MFGERCGAPKFSKPPNILNPVNSCPPPGTRFDSVIENRAGNWSSPPTTHQLQGPFNRKRPATIATAPGTYLIPAFENRGRCKCEIGPSLVLSPSQIDVDQINGHSARARCSQARCPRCPFLLNVVLQLLKGPTSWRGWGSKGSAPLSRTSSHTHHQGAGSIWGAVPNFETGMAREGNKVRIRNLAGIDPNSVLCLQVSRWKHLAFGGRVSNFDGGGSRNNKCTLLLNKNGFENVCLIGFCGL